jgi:FtsP/CotA-like multicopper oxidase with cupredoxin domain
MNRLTRRDFLKTVGGVVALASVSSPVLAGCQTIAAAADTGATTATSGLAVAPKTPTVFPAGTGTIREFDLTAALAPVDLGSGEFQAWTYNGLPVGPEIRVTEGDTIRVTLTNSLPDPTTIHWHGLPVPNGMDGVPGVTQPPVQPGESFMYEFPAWPSGTYWYHPHVGHQLDRGLVGPLVIEPKNEVGDYDREYTLLLDDWVTVDGGGPEAALRASGGMMGGMTGRSMMGGGFFQGNGDSPLQEPIYTTFAVNGLTATAANPFAVKQGERVRLRLINGSGATIYGLRLAGHSLTITHTDGRPVYPFEVDVLRIGMGERYDVLFTADNPGRWTLYDTLGVNGSGRLDLAAFQYANSIGAQDSGDNLTGNFRWNDYRLLTGRP